MANTVDIDHKPGKSEKVYGLTAPTRASGGSRAMTIKWNLGKWATDGKNPWRIQGFDIYFDIILYDWNQKKWRKIYYQYTTPNTSRRDWTIYLDGGFKCTDKKTYKRSKDFYPIKNVALRYITAKVRTYNSKGRGEWVTATCKFDKPRNPNIESIEQVGDTGMVRVKVSHNKGLDWKEVWNTQVVMKVYSSKDKKYLSYLNYTDVIGTNVDNKTFELVDVYSRMRQSYDDYYSVDVSATTRGLWGNSDTVKRNIYVSWPYKPKITSVNAKKLDQKAIDDDRIGQEYLNSKVTIGIQTDLRTDAQKKKGVKNAHPTTGVKLQKLVNVDYEREFDIPGDADWEDCGAVDNGGCTALSSTVAELQPERGKKTWVRVKSWNQIEDIFYRYSDVKRLTTLERAPRSASEAKIKVLNTQSGDDGKSAVIDVAWTNDEATGTEISWSENKNAWRSTDDPETYRVTYDDGSRTFGNTTYSHSARINIANLTEGTTYYVRARRYYIDDDDNESFGAYFPADTTVDGLKVCDSVPVIPVTSPSSVVLNAPSFVIRGASIPLNWTFDSEAEQTEWELITGTAVELTKTVDGNTVTYTRIDEEDRTTTDPSTGRTVTTAAKVIHLAGGVDSMGSCVLPYNEHLEQIVNPPGETPDDEIPLAVRVRTGGEFVTSDAVMVRLADPPVLTVSAADLTAQPLSVSLTCNVPASITLVATSQYIAGEYAGGFMAQTFGDTIWSTVTIPTVEYDDEDNVINPGWVYDDNDELYHATIVATTGLDFLDGGRYTITAKATDTTTSLVSKEVTCEFDVDYARKAPSPSEDIMVVPYDTIDATSGLRTRGCEIVLATPTDGISTDLYDVYRVTADGPQLCARSVPTDATVNDRFAPYGKEGDLSYRVSCRTVDGCEEWLDYKYELSGHDMRIDFGDEYVELPYNLKAEDNYEKDFEARRHLDGSIDGYWNEGAKRTASLSTDLIRIKEEEKARAIRRLARHCGPTFLRLGDGTAYQADVQVHGLGREATSSAISVSISATEVGLTDDCMAEVNVVSEEPEQEQEQEQGGEG